MSPTRHRDQVFLQSAGQTMCQNPRWSKLPAWPGRLSVVLAEGSAPKPPKDCLKRCFNSSWQRSSWDCPGMSVEGIRPGMEMNRMIPGSQRHVSQGIIPSSHEYQWRAH